MSCNCKSCECNDRSVCLKIENRLYALANIFDNVSNNLALASQSIFNDFTPVTSKPVCQAGSAGSQVSNFFTYAVSGTTPINLFDNLSTYTPVNFLPNSFFPTIGENELFISNALLCLPVLKETCMTCTSFGANVNTICSFGNDSTLTTNWSHLAENFRTTALLFGCSNN